MDETAALDCFQLALSSYAAARKKQRLNSDGPKEEADTRDNASSRGENQDDNSYVWTAPPLYDNNDDA